jgi:transposase
MGREFLERCLAEGMSLKQIGKRVGRGPSTISYHLKKHGLQAVHEEVCGTKEPVSEDSLKEMVEEGASIREMANRLDRSPTTVQRWLARYGLKPLAGSRRSQARRARQAGLTRALLTCKHHGRTPHVLEGRGSYRCMKCRAAAVIRWRRSAKRRLVEEAGGRCALCGYDEFPGALHFHHLDPSTKSFGLAMRGLTRSIEQLRGEAAKCILLCANCHAKVEWGVAVLPASLISRPEGGDEDEDAGGNLKAAA